MPFRDPHLSGSEPDWLFSLSDAVIPLAGTAFAIGPYTLGAERSRITSIVGPSGSGKTTLLRAIADQKVPLAGQISSSALPAQVAYVPQNVSDRLNGFATALRHLRDVSAKLGRDEAAAQLRRFSIPTDALTRSTRTFSAGQQQRLVLLIALLRQPKLVILDEPTSALDVEMRQELAVILRKMADEDGVTVLIATHHLPFVSVISDRIWRLHRVDAREGVS